MGNQENIKIIYSFLIYNSNKFSRFLIIYAIVFATLNCCNGQSQRHPAHRRQQHANTQRMLQANVQKNNPTGFMTAPQCKCDDLKECNKELNEITNKCKVLKKCENFLKKIGDSAKIRACLNKEQTEMDRLEECVEKRVGPIGCTNDPHPKNLTIPIMGMNGGNDGSNGGCNNNGHRRTARKAQQQQQHKSNQQEIGHAPMELSDYLMCVDECSMNELNNESKMCTSRQTPLNCAVKLQCTLAPPDAKAQRTFAQCEKELNLMPERRFKNSCNCLKSAGVHIQCPK